MFICVERLCAFFLSCRQNTEPNRLDSKKNKSQSRENTTLKTLKCVSWSETDRKSCTNSNFRTQYEKTTSPFHEAANHLVSTVATSGRRCGIMLISFKNWTFRFGSFILFTFSLALTNVIRHTLKEHLKIFNSRNKKFNFEIGLYKLYSSLGR